MGRITKKLTPEERKKKQEQLTQKRTTVTESGEVIVEKPKPAPVVTAAAPVKANKEPNFFQKAAQFLRETKLEFKRVTWPTRQQTIATTAVVIILVIIIAIFLGVVDRVLFTGVRLLLGS